MSAPFPPCPACRGRGWRIVTQDGTRPACIACGGAGSCRDARLGPGHDAAPGGFPSPSAGAANAPAASPPPAPQEAGRRPFLATEAVHG